MMATPQPDRDRLTLFEIAIVLALLFYALACAVGVVWLLLKVARLIHATGYGAQICTATVLLVMVAIVADMSRQ
jgi:hypothetical protein